MKHAAMKHAAPAPADTPSKKKKGKVVVIIFLVVFIVGFAVGAFMLSKTVITAVKEQNTFDDLQKIVEDVDNGDELSENGTLRKYDPLYEKNKDFFGWLKIEGMNIDYPVMYRPGDSEYYLHHDFYGDYSESGMLFIDGDCPYDSNYYLIYGHHMHNGSMFGSLPDYGDYEFYKKHKTVFFDTRFERRDYEICSVFYSEVYDRKDEAGKFCYYNVKDLRSKEKFDEYVANIKQRSIYDTGVTPTFGDQLITLSTCNYHTEDGRFVVVARQVKQEKKATETTAPVSSSATAKPNE